MIVVDGTITPDYVIICDCSYSGGTMTDYIGY